MNVMNVVVICEESGIVREAFRRLGHNAISVDLKPSRLPGPHLQGDVIAFLAKHAKEFDLMIAHPFCTYTSVSGNAHYADTHYRRYGIAFAECIWDQPIELKCLEHPVSVLSTCSDIEVEPQYIQPNEFGHDASKNTGLFLYGLPQLVGTKYIPASHPGLNGKLVWANQTPSGQNKLGPSPIRKQLRSETYQGIADAMADQWGRPFDLFTETD